MEIQAKVSNYAKMEQRVIRSVVLAPGVVAYEIRVANDRVIDSKPESLPAQVLTGLTSPEGLADYEAGRSVQPLMPRRDRGKLPLLTIDQKVWSYIHAVRPSYIDALRQHGFSHPKEDFMAVSDPLGAFERGEQMVLVDLHNGANQVFDLAGVPYACQQSFDYINGHFHDGKYNLEHAVEILLKRPDIVLLPNAGENQYRKQTETNYIAPIPYYNASSEKQHCIAFYWRPSREDYCQVYAAAQKGDSTKEPFSSDIDAAIEKLDLFGLVSGGAVLPEPAVFDTDDNDNE